MICCYVLSDKETQYSSQFKECDCVEGNREDLIFQIKNNRQFCRDQSAISYNYFVDTLKTNTIIYKKNSDNQILGACSIYLDTDITIYGICVPDIIKGIGTILLDKVKCIGKLINASSINLSANKSVSDFYIKNGFVIDPYNNSHDDRIQMTYNFEKTPAKGGKRKTTSQKSKRKNKQCKITKKRNKNFSKKRKYQKYHRP
jgi:hypothetical protein